MMNFERFAIEGLVLITPRTFEDERGFFLERYNRQVFREQGGIEIDFIQDNHSQSTRGILRGLHFQRSPYAQDKLVWVTRGEVFDVAVDLRVGSPTFGQWHGVTLSEANKRVFLVPKGFAHGFVVLSDVADFQYKVSAYYSKAHDVGVMWNDPELGVQWPYDEPILSPKDQQLQSLSDLQAAGLLFSMTP